MKKLLVLMLVLGMAAAANATIVQVEVDLAGSISGNMGTGPGDLLVKDDQVKLKVTLTDLDNYAPYSSYDGYVLSTVAFTMNTDADASAYVKAAPAPATPKSVLSPYSVASDGSGGLDISGAGPVAGYAAGQGATIIWNFWLDITTADGQTDLTLDLDPVGGASTYKLKLSDTSWTTMVEADLGDLTLYTVPEPMTIALLGLGGLFLRRRK